MSKTEVIKWLSEWVKIYKMSNKIRNLNDGERVFSSEYGCCYSGHMSITNIEEVAEVLGVKLKAEPFNCCGSEYKSDLSFVFKGVKFHELSTKEVSDFE